MTAHSRIRQRRLELGMTQAELIERIQEIMTGFNRFQLSKLERGVRVVRSEELPIFAAALECDYETLLGPIPTLPRFKKPQ
jgi:transcriptional regulator with XRE-family HTH domain